MGVIPTSHKTLELAATLYGSLAEQTPDAPDPRRMAEQRRLLWGVMHRLPDDDRHIITRLAAGHSHDDIAKFLQVSRNTLTERIPLVLARVRWWIERPFLPDDDELREHLAGCPRVTRTRRIVGYLAGVSLREIAAREGCQHNAVYRSILRGVENVRTRTAENCETCRAVVLAEKHRRAYRPPTTTTRLKATR